MRMLRLGVAALALAAAATVLPSTPASAHTNAGACVFQGNASVSPGLMAGLPINAGWSFSSALDVCATSAGPVGVGSGNVSGSGSLFGLCGGSLGSGTANFAGDSVAITFATVGGTGVLVGADVGNPIAVAATFQARPLPSAVGAVPCVTEPATNFLIVGAGVGADAA